MIGRAALLLALTAALAVPAAAQEGRTVAVVLDRSASLRASDPQGRGPALLAQTLALALGPNDKLTVLATGGPDVPARAIGNDPRALAPLFEALLAATPRPGGADLTASLVTACRRAGKAGLVIVYTDDDLDVVAPDGTVPAQVQARAAQDHPDPTRTQVNAAALTLLVEAVKQVTPRPTLLGLRAPLPPTARATPILTAIGAKVIDLQKGLAAADAIGRTLAGDSVVARVIDTKPNQRSLELPYPARVAIVSSRPVTIAGATALDGRGGRLWLAETPGKLALPGGAALRCLVVPAAKIPDGVVAYRLRRGVVRVVAPKRTPAGALAVRFRDDEQLLQGDPPTLDLQTGGVSEAPVLLRVVTEGERRIVAARRRLTPKEAKVTLTVAGATRVGQTLTLSGALPPGLTLAALPVNVKEGAGAPRRIELKAADGKLSGSFPSQSAGALSVKSDGEVEVALAKPVTIDAAAKNALVVKAITSGGKPVETTPPLITDDTAVISVSLAVEPKPPGPIQATITLAGAPEGASLAPAGPFTITETLTVELTITWPKDTPGALIGLKIEDPKGAAAPANASFEVRRAPSPIKKILAGVLLVLAVLWGLWIFRWRKREENFLEHVIAKKQLRTLGPNGRISPERYMLRDYFETSDQGLIVQPDESPGGEMVLTVRADGDVDCVARDGAKLVHSDRPTVLADQIILNHGTAFAMVHKNRALRYVYLTNEPSGEELTTRWLGDGVSYDVEVRDSGVFVLLDEDQNVPKMSARLEASADTLFPESDMIHDSASEVGIVPPSGDGAPLVSDEGLVIMDSAEGRIMESEEVEFLERSTDLGNVGIRLEDLMSDSTEDPPGDA